MAHSGTMSSKINRLHERSLRIVYSDQGSTFEELLEIEKTFFIHHKNIQSLATEIYVEWSFSRDNEQRVSFKRNQPNQSEKCIWALQSQPKNSKMLHRNNLILSAKNMICSTSDHKRKHFRIFLQNKNKEMETRLPMSALQEIFATWWFCIKVNFISLVNLPCEETYSEPIQTSRMELSACIDNGGSPWIILMGSCT